MNTKSSALTLILIIQLLFFIVSPAYNQDAADEKEIILLFPWHEVRSWNYDFMDGFYTVLNENTDMKISFSFEHLEIPFSSDPAAIEAALEKMQMIRKYNNPDLIISTFPSVHPLVLNQGEEIFPGVTKVFVPATREQAEEINKLPHSYIISSSVEYATRTTLDHLKMILPDLENLIVVSGVGGGEEYYLNLFKKIVEETNLGVELTYYSGLPIRDLVLKLSILPDNSAIFLLPNTRDLDNNIYTTEELLSSIIEIADAPSFSTDGSSFGQGIVGGVMVSSEYYGKYTAEAVFHFLSTKEWPDDNNREKTIEKYDWRVLQKWGIDEDLLPEGSEVSFKTETFVEKYRIQIMFITLLILLESFLLMILFVNLNKRRRIESLLINNQELLDRSQKSAKVGGWDFDIASGRMSCTKEMFNILELDPESNMTKEMFINFFHPESLEKVDDAFKKIIADNVPFEQEVRLITARGNVIWVNSKYKAVVQDGKTVRISGTLQNITVRKIAELEHQNSLKEKEILLNEVHHRVKNNLSIMSSLLELQKETITDRPMKELLLVSQNRILSMALLHEQLYNEQNLQCLTFSQYAKPLAEEIVSSYHYKNLDVKITFNIIEQEVDIDTLVPLGIILNEIISNSMKHAFNNIENPQIDISLKKKPNNRLVLSIKDNGTGLADDSILNQKETIGILLIRSLVTQIDGKLEIIRERGTNFIITFGLQMNSE